MPSIAERMKAAMELRNIKQTDLVRKTGIGKSSISTYLSGDYEPKQKNIYKIALALDVSEAWLMGYDVPMEREQMSLWRAKEQLQEKLAASPSMKSGKKLAFLFDKADFDPTIVAFNLDIDQSYLDGWMSYEILPPSPIVDKILACVQIKPRDFFDNVEFADYLSQKADYAPSIPVDHPAFSPLPRMKEWAVLGATACGKPLNLETPDETVFAPEDIKADVVFRCVGDSMINARIFDGDLVFVRLQPEVENGQIAVVRIDDEYTLKRFHAGDGYVELRAENPTFPPIILRGAEAGPDRFEVVGLATAFLSPIK